MISQNMHSVMHFNKFSVIIAMFEINRTKYKMIPYNLDEWYERVTENFVGTILIPGANVSIWGLKYRTCRNKIHQASRLYRLWDVVKWQRPWTQLLHRYNKYYVVILNQGVISLFWVYRILGHGKLIASNITMRCNETCSDFYKDFTKHNQDKSM